MWASVDFNCSNYVKYSDSYPWTNSENPDQTAPKEQFDQGLHFLPFCQLLLNTSLRSQMKGGRF